MGGGAEPAGGMPGSMRPTRRRAPRESNRRRPPIVCRAEGVAGKTTGGKGGERPSPPPSRGAVQLPPTGGARLPHPRHSPLRPVAQESQRPSLVWQQRRTARAPPLAADGECGAATGASPPHAPTRWPPCRRYPATTGASTAGRPRLPHRRPSPRRRPVPPAAAGGRQPLSPLGRPRTLHRRGRYKRPLGGGVTVSRAAGGEGARARARPRRRLSHDRGGSVGRRRAVRGPTRRGAARSPASLAGLCTGDAGASG